MDTDTPLPEGRLEAAKAGSRYYLASAPCPKMHEPVRYTRNGACRQCALDAASAVHERVKRLMAGDSAA